MVDAKASTVESLAADCDLARRPRTQELARVAASSEQVAQWRNLVKVAFGNNLVWLTPRSLYLSAMDDALSWTPDTAFAAW